jgi:hypothetical protein
MDKKDPYIQLDFDNKGNVLYNRLQRCKKLPKVSKTIPDMLNDIWFNEYRHPISHIESNIFDNDMDIYYLPEIKNKLLYGKSMKKSVPKTQKLSIKQGDKSSTSSSNKFIRSINKKSKCTGNQCNIIYEDKYNDDEVLIGGIGIKDNENINGKKLVNIRSINGDNYNVPICDDECVKEVKRKIEEQSKFNKYNKENIDLLYKGNILEDEMKINEYKMKNQDVIYLHIKLKIMM